MSRNAYNNALTNMRRKTEKNITPAKLKDGLRKQFIERVKEMRYQNVNARRNIPELNLELCKIKEDIKQEYDVADSNIDQNEILESLNDIISELLNLENDALIEKYFKEQEEETNSIVNNLFVCKVCDEIRPDDADVCSSCLATFDIS